MEKMNREQISVGMLIRLQREKKKENWENEIKIAQFRRQYRKRRLTGIFSLYLPFTIDERKKYMYRYKAMWQSLCVKWHEHLGGKALKLKLSFHSFTTEVLNNATMCMGYHFLSFCLKRCTNRAERMNFWFQVSNFMRY